MKKVILIIIAAVIVAGGIGGYFIFKKPVSLEPKPPIEQVGKCGDNICDDFEKAHPNACPADCKISANTEINKNSPFGASPFLSFNKSFREDPQPPKPKDFDFKPTKDLGLKWGRAHYLTWPIVQPSKKHIDSNIYDWSDSDEVIGSYPVGFNAVENIQAFGIEIGETGEQIDSFSFSTKDAEDDYMRFVQKGVERYDGDGKDDMPGLKNPIKYWQVENEPDLKTKDWEGYAHLLKITYDGIKSVCADCKVVIGGMGGEMKGLNEFFKPVLEKLGGKYFDIFDYHCYGRKDDWKKCGQMAEEIKKAFPNNNFEIWLTETGTWSGIVSDMSSGQLSPPQSEKEQASALVKYYLYNLSKSVKKIFWAWGILEGFEGPENNIFDKTGLIYDGYFSDDLGLGVKKLSYYAYKKMVEVLEGSDWNNIETIQETGGVYVYKFTKNGKPIWVAWNDNAGEKQITISGVNSSSVKITESVPNYSSGKEVKDYATAFKTEIKQIINNKLTIILSETPVFEEGD